MIKTLLVVCFAIASSIVLGTILYAATNLGDDEAFIFAKHSIIRFAILVGIAFIIGIILQTKGVIK